MKDYSEPELVVYPNMIGSVGQTLVMSVPAHPNSRGLFLTPCRPRYVSIDLFWSKNQENRPSFQSTPFNRKYPWNLLRLKMEIVNIMNFGLIL